MDIVVFDDNIQFLDYMKNILIELNAKHNGAFNTLTFFSETENILAYAEANKDSITAYILDIMKDDIQIGFDISKRIKEINSSNIIIYITDYKDKILFDIHNKILAFVFILKHSKIFHAELEGALLNAKGFFGGQYFLGKRRNSIVKVRLDEIYYFEKIKNTGYVQIYTKDNNEKIWDLLQNIKKKLNSDFCYSSRTCIVNRKTIRRIDKVKMIIHFDNGHECPYTKPNEEKLLRWM